MTDPKELLTRQLARLIESRSKMDEQIEHRKSELLPYLPGYYPEDTVLVYGGKRTDQWRRIKIVKQFVIHAIDGWAVGDTHAVGLYDDDSFGERLHVEYISHYHPEPTGGIDE